jgi:hypothetical protein
VVGAAVKQLSRPLNEGDIECVDRVHGVSWTLVRAATGSGPDRVLASSRALCRG